MSEGLRELLAAQLLKDNDDTKFNVRDFTDVLFDLEDPIDLTAAALTATGAGVPAAAGIKALNTKRKAANLLRAFLVPTKASKNPTKEVGRKIGNVVKFQVAGETAADVIPGVDGMAVGGIAQLQDGGKLERVLGIIPALKKFVKGKKLFDKAKDAKKVSKTDFPKDVVKSTKEKPLLISPGSDLKKVRDAAEAILKSDLTRKTLRGAQRLGLYGGATGLAGYTAKKGYDALFGEDAPEEKKGGEDFIPEVKEPKSFLEKLKDMDPALARALIAGGAKMLQPTEGPVRSFLGLGEFGEGFSESLAASEAGKSDTQQLYEAYLASVPEGQAPLDIVRFANSLKQDSDDLQNQENRLLTYLQENTKSGDNLTLSDFAVEKTDLAEIGIDYQGEKDPSVRELLLRYSGPERESVVNLIVSKSYVKD